MLKTTQQIKNIELLCVDGLLYLAVLCHNNTYLSTVFLPYIITLWPSCSCT